jgi:hypothetical protein
MSKEQTICREEVSGVYCVKGVGNLMQSGDRLWRITVTAQGMSPKYYQVLGEQFRILERTDDDNGTIFTTCAIDSNVNPEIRQVVLGLIEAWEN